MDHTTALNLILANCCPVRRVADTDVFILEGHCMDFTVYAKLVSTKDSIQYEIIKVDWSPN